MKAYARNSTDYQAFSRDVVVEVNGTEYWGTLTYNDWEGYDWEGDEIKGVEMDQQWFYDLDTATCDVEYCTACQPASTSLDLVDTK